MQTLGGQSMESRYYSALAPLLLFQTTGHLHSLSTRAAGTLTRLTQMNVGCHFNDSGSNSENENAQINCSRCLLAEFTRREVEFSAFILFM